eukprot:8288563-Pyramimonas_sp.AAC.1
MAIVAVAGMSRASIATAAPGGVAESSTHTVIGRTACPNGSISTGTITSTYGHGTTSSLSPSAGSMIVVIVFGTSVTTRSG